MPRPPRGRRGPHRRPPRSGRRGARSGAPPRPRCASPTVARPGRAEDVAWVVRSGDHGRFVEGRRQPARYVQAAPAQGSMSPLLEPAEPGRPRRRAVVAAMHFSAEHQTCTEPGRTERTQSSRPRATPSHCSPTAARLVSLSTITGTPSRSAAASAKCIPSSPSTLVNPTTPVAVSTTAGATTTAVSISDPDSAVASTSESQRAEGVQHCSRVRADELDVGARNLTAEVADRSAQETGAEVEPHDERCLRDRLEEQRAVPRPAGVLDRLAHQARVQERLQGLRDGRFRDPARREISAREMGAPSRIASRTVHSLRFFSGVARVTPIWSTTLTQRSR